MVNFYAQIAKMLAKEPFEDCINSIQTTLPELSSRGSQDDMSVACVFDENALVEVARRITEWQLRNVLATIQKLNERIVRFSEEYEQFLKVRNLTDKEKIDKQNTLNALKRAFEFKREQANRYNRFSQELYGDDFEPFNDDIGLAEIKILEAEVSQVEESEGTSQTTIEQVQEPNVEEPKPQECDEVETAKPDAEPQQEGIKTNDAAAVSETQQNADEAQGEKTLGVAENNVEDKAEQLDSAMTETKTDSENE